MSIQRYEPVAAALLREADEVAERALRVEVEPELGRLDRHLARDPALGDRIETPM
jgi:hypothetical protein